MRVRKRGVRVGVRAAAHLLSTRSGLLLRSESCSMRAARRLESGGSSGSGSRGGTLAEGGRQAGLQEGRKEGKGGGCGE